MSHSTEIQRRRHVGQALTLCGLSLVNYFAFYAINIFLARRLSVHEFDDYNVAVATTLVLAALSTLGIEKFALQCLPVLKQRGDWPRSRGFLRFARRLVLTTGSVLAFALAVVLETTLQVRGSDYHISIVIVAAFLPAIALSLTLLEIVTAYGGPISAVVCYRLLLPGTILALNFAVALSPLHVTAVSAAICYGLGWVAALIVLQLRLRCILPGAILDVEHIAEKKVWMRGAIPLLWSSLLLTLMAQSGIIVLELVHPSQPVVSHYAVAFQTGTFVVLLATSTNRLYLPRMSSAFDRQDVASLLHLGRVRLALISLLSGGILLATILWGRSILGLFGSEFPSAYPALVIVAAGASLSTLFSVSPFFLQYSGRNRFVIAALLVAVALQITSCFPLAYHFGATGTAFSYAVPVALLYLVLRFAASRHIKNHTVPPEVEFPSI